MSRGTSSVNNLPKSKESSRSSSPYLQYAIYENETKLINNNNNNHNYIHTNINSRFKKVPVLTIENMDIEIKADQPRKRFEVEKVEENSSLQVAAQNSSTENENSTQFLIDNSHNNADTINSVRSDYSKKSALKKTVTKYEHDDSLLEKEAIIPKNPVIDDDDDDDDEDDETPTCVKVNYNKRNEARSITVNCGSPTMNTYMACCNDIKSLTFYKKLIAEFIGTMFLVIYVCSMGLRVSEKDGVPSINGAIGSGLIVATIVWCLGNISGAHINPAITISFLFTGKLNPLATIFYIGFQLLGALTGSFILRDLVPDYALSKLSITEIHPEMNVAQAFGVEFIITFILVLTVFSCVDENRNDIHGSFPLTIGLAIIIGSLFGGPFTGGSMNPARSFGPAVVMNMWKDHWVYWIGPISGGITAGILYKFILTQRCLRRRTKQRSVA